MSSEKTTEKIEAFWQDATADDVVEIMKTGKPIPARVRNEEGDSWRDDAFLQGWINGNWVARGAYWTHCQVYREPSWWTNRPDPGPEHRLLGKLPDEELKPGDEYFDRPTGRWHLSGHAKTQQQQLTETWYRRRIEPVEPDPKHYVLRVGDSVETPGGHRTVVTPQGGTQRFLNVKAGDTIKTIHGHTITIAEKGFEVTQ
jgi:hypothetical protein